MQEFFGGAGLFLLYLIPAAFIILLVRKFTKIPDELFRKILHFILLGAYIPLLFGFKTWWISIIFVVSLIALLYPAIILIGKIPDFSSFINERRKGEFLNSMVLALGVMAVSVAVGWGMLGDKYIVLSSIYSWGVGDAFAALIGKKYGKHKITLKFVDSKKSFEGSFAMLISSSLAVFAVLMIRGGITPILSALIAITAATAATFAELCSKNGMDTVTCPAVSMAIIATFITLIGG